MFQKTSPDLTRIPQRQSVVQKNSKDSDILYVFLVLLTVSATYCSDQPCVTSSNFVSATSCSSVSPYSDLKQHVHISNLPSVLSAEKQTSASPDINYTETLCASLKSITVQIFLDYKHIFEHS